MIPTTIPYKLIAGVVGGLVAALALYLLVHDRNHWKATAETRQTELIQAKDALANTVQNYRTAAAQAAKEDAANVARVKAAQASINESTSSEYETRIAAANAQYERLQRTANAAAAHSGRSGPAPVSNVPSSATGTPQAAPQDGLSAPLAPGDALTATDQAIQLDELIKWVDAQVAIPAQPDTQEKQ